MCGIFSYIGNNQNLDIKKIQEEFLKTTNRGPDDTIMKSISNKLIFGFHRLSINDTSFKGNQPLYHPKKPYVVICNGEIYNYEELKSELNVETYSGSDCEIILYLYEKHYSLDTILNKLDGVFSFVLYDGESNIVHVARDPFGVRPLFFGHDLYHNYVFASEMKSIQQLCNPLTIEQFKPGFYLTYSLHCDKIVKYLKYFDIKRDVTYEDEELILQNINLKLKRAVEKRLLSDRPIGCLLSGGLDSSLIASITASYFKKNNKGKLKTFSIGLPGSTDLKYADMVAKHIGSEHHTVSVTEEEFLGAIPEVIQQIESYDTTTVRASVGNYLVAKYIKQNTDITVVFNGDGSDEQSGYIYLANAPSDFDFYNECFRLLSEIHYFDVLRSDRSISSNWSLESRTPFLDKDFVNYYMNIPTEYKTYKGDKIEKYMLRKAFEKDNLLPSEVLWRRKEAFSDGCSSKERSWHSIIKEHIDKIITDEEFEMNKNKYIHNAPMLKESYYYRKIYDKFYPNTEHVIPHFWLPRWCGEQIDPSARELANY